MKRIPKKLALILITTISSSASEPVVRRFYPAESRLLRLRLGRSSKIGTRSQPNCELAFAGDSIRHAQRHFQKPNQKRDMWWIHQLAPRANHPGEPAPPEKAANIGQTKVKLRRGKPVESRRSPNSSSVRSSVSEGPCEKADTRHRLKWKEKRVAGF